MLDWIPVARERPPLRPIVPYLVCLAGTRAIYAALCDPTGHWARLPDMEDLPDVTHWARFDFPADPGAAT